MSEELKIQKIKTSELKIYEKNIKKHPQSHVNLIMKSINAFGFKNPILIDKNHTIIAGHGRLLAAKQLEIEEIPCIMIEDLPEEAIKAFRIMDNKSQESDYDFDILREEIISLKEENFDLNFTGISEKELNDIFKEELLTVESKENTTQDQDTPLSNTDPNSTVRFGKHRFTLKEIKEMPNRKILQILIDDRKNGLNKYSPMYERLTKLQEEEKLTQYDVSHEE